VVISGSGRRSSFSKSSNEHSSGVAELASVGTRLEVLAVAPEECSFEDLEKLDRRPDPEITTRCVAAAYADVDTLASEVIGRLRAGS
jgi:hypothetical protein